MAVKDKIFQYRRNLNMTQEELAAKLSVSQRTISSWETGRTVPSIDEIVQLCGIFGCNFAEITDTHPKSTGEESMELIIDKLRDLDEKSLLYIQDKISAEIEIKSRQRLMEEENRRLEAELEYMRKKIAKLEKQVKSES